MSFDDWWQEIRTTKRQWLAGYIIAKHAWDAGSDIWRKAHDAIYEENKTLKIELKKAEEIITNTMTAGFEMVVKETAEECAQIAEDFTPHTDWINTASVKQRQTMDSTCVNIAIKIREKFLVG